MQLDWPVLFWYWVGSQALHSLAPPAANVPALHLVLAELPSQAWPAGHTEQPLGMVTLFTFVAEVNVYPLEQRSQLVAPSGRLLEQYLQAVCPCCFWYLPTMHALHSAWPAWSWYLPAGQAEHTASLPLPSFSNDPFAHALTSRDSHSPPSTSRQSRSLPDMAFLFFAKPSGSSGHCCSRRNLRCWRCSPVAPLACTCPHADQLLTTQGRARPKWGLVLKPAPLMVMVGGRLKSTTLTMGNTLRMVGGAYENPPKVRPATATVTFTGDPPGTRGVLIWSSAPLTREQAAAACLV